MPYTVESYVQHEGSWSDSEHAFGLLHCKKVESQGSIYITRPVRTERTKDFDAAYLNWQTAQHGVKSPIVYRRSR